MTTKFFSKREKIQHPIFLMTIDPGAMGVLAEKLWHKRSGMKIVKIDAETISVDDVIKFCIVDNCFSQVEYENFKEKHSKECKNFDNVLVIPVVPRVRKVPRTKLKPVICIISFRNKTIIEEKLKAEVIKPEMIPCANNCFLVLNKDPDISS